LPAHGFARTAEWSVVESGSDANGVWLLLRLEMAAAQRTLWPHAADLTLRVSLSTTLALELSTRNASQEAFVLGEALHTYFNISDIGAILVGGLSGVTYWDTVGSVEKKKQSGPIAFTQETDRVYIDSPHTCAIEDSGFARRIHIRKQGSLSTVVWNPWTDKAERMGDLGKPDGWRSFVCVESANAWDNKITLQPGETHTLKVEYEVEAL
jgi:D-hexose-6-phosphate mutarotase